VAGKAAFLALAGCVEGKDDKLADVRERGEMVMGFDLEKTTHTFAGDTDGGVQSVVVKDLKDTENLLKLREHLKEVAEKFSRGDFEDPETIHGENMDGVKELKTLYKEITISYKDIENGGEISYTTKNGEAIMAIHHWFEAQLREHGVDDERDVGVAPPGVPYPEEYNK
jgi:hypothetical protein